MGWHRVPTGLEDVSKYPALVAELLARNWTEQEVRGALAENLLRVFREVERVSGAREAQGCMGHGDTGTGTLGAADMGGTPWCVALRNLWGHGEAQGHMGHQDVHGMVWGGTGKCGGSVQTGSSQPAPPCPHGR